MRFTKLMHAGVKLVKDGGTLVIDPGPFTEGAEALAEADAVLITHEHADHVEPDSFRTILRARPDLQVWSNESVTEHLTEFGDRIHQVRHGDSFTAAGFDVHVYGERHALSFPGDPPVRNTGYLVDAALFHPGDSFTIPEGKVDTLLVPVTAPWLKWAEFVEYFRAVSPRQGYAIHDAMLTEFGLTVLNSWLPDVSELAGASLTRLPPGGTVDL
ncbi:MAG TPA: MBL fold metallo-hydrolase [Streptosporangiaceae bacterium]|jgi:L-ascorbate metabolism protein UlaG (beta-lactamase superfamily)